MTFWFWTIVVVYLAYGWSEYRSTQRIRAWTDDLLEGRDPTPVGERGGIATLNPVKPSDVAQKEWEDRVMRGAYYVAGLVVLAIVLALLAG